MASDQDINKRLRSLHQEFDYLLDNNVITTELYDELCQRIPRRKSPPLKILLTSGYNSSTAAAAKAPPTVAVPINAPSSPPASVTSLASQMNATGISDNARSPPPPPPPPAPTSPPPYGLAQAEALYDYTSTDEGDLKIHAGEKITILEYVNNGSNPFITDNILILCRLVERRKFCWTTRDFSI